MIQLYRGQPGNGEVGHTGSHSQLTRADMDRTAAGRAGVGPDGRAGRGHAAAGPLDQQRPTSTAGDLLTLAADAVQDARIIAPTEITSTWVRRRVLILGDEVRLRRSSAT
jgi:hypothetical protein